MPIIQPPKERHSILEEGSTLKISIPSRRNIFIIVMTGAWLVMWAFIEIGFCRDVIPAFISLSRNLPGASTASTVGFLGIVFSMFVWFIVWTIGGGFAAYSFLWQLAGKERIEMSYESIEIQRAVFGLGRVREYLAAHVKDLRVAPPVMSNAWLGLNRSRFWGKSGGFLAFDYGARTFHFGDGIDEAEAKQILEKILVRFPNYRVH